VRTWELSPLKIEELVEKEEVNPELPKKVKKPAKMKNLSSKRKPPCL